MLTSREKVMATITSLVRAIVAIDILQKSASSREAVRFALFLGSFLCLGLFEVGNTVFD